MSSIEGVYLYTDACAPESRVCVSENAPRRPSVSVLSVYDTRSRVRLGRPVVLDRGLTSVPPEQ